VENLKVWSKGVVKNIREGYGTYEEENRKRREQEKIKEEEENRKEEEENRKRREQQAADDVISDAKSAMELAPSARSERQISLLNRLQITREDEKEQATITPSHKRSSYQKALVREWR
jgi:hypothetical protein